MSLRYKCHKSKFNINRKAVLRIKLLLIVFYPVWMRLYPMFVVVQFPSHVQLFVTPWTAALQASLSLTISQSLPKFMSIALVMPSSYLFLRSRSGSSSRSNDSRLRNKLSRAEPTSSLKVTEEVREARELVPGEWSRR